MHLYEQIINKKMELYEENNLKRKYKKGLWNFFIAYNLSLAILNLKDKNNKLKNRLFKRFIISNKEIDSKLFKRLQKLIINDINIINECLNFIEIKKEEQGYEFGDMYKISTLGVLDSEYPE